MSDAQYEAKLKDMQKYLPFIQQVIDRLKVNNEQMADNPRKAQLEKMEKLHDLLKGKVKNIKVETLVKCEGVIKRLQQKIEMQPSFQNEDALLNKVQLKRPLAPSPATSSKPTTELEESAGPASPPPETVDYCLEQPVVIPTERRCSPIMLKEKIKELQKLPQTQKQKDAQHSSTHFSKESKLTQGRFDNNRTGNKQHSSTSHSHHKQHHHNRSYYDNHSSSQGPSHSHKSSIRSNTPLPKEKQQEPAQKLQTVKLVITEPLSAHIKQQHFPSSSKYMPPRASICFNNLKTLPQVSQEQDNNEAYNPEESWEQYNESRYNSLNKSHSPSTVFKRLGAKVPNTSHLAKETTTTTPLTTKTAGRYTPIPDVLKSPPLSVNDINNLLLESGADKNDISAIGTRRPPKLPCDLQNSPTNSLELSRKRLAETVRLNSPNIESPKQRDDQDYKNERNTTTSTNLPEERIALKYNPHPKQERLQSISSTDGSEYSIQTKINDPRIKQKVLNSPVPQCSPGNVNVLPAINFNDPRLKKQNFPNLTNTHTNLRNINCGQTCTPILGYPPQQQQQNSGNFMTRQDPRMARQQNINMPPRRTSISQPHYSSEENWDTDEEDKSKKLNKSDPRLDKRPESRPESRYDNIFDNRARSCTPKPDNRSRSCTPNAGNYSRNAGSFSYVRDNYVESNKSCPQLNISETNKNSEIYIKEPKKKEPETIIVSNPPKSDTEEDWNSEPDEGNNKSKPKPKKVSTSETATKPVTESLHTTNTFDSVAKPVPALNSFENVVAKNVPTLHNFKSLLNYVSPPTQLHTIEPPPLTSSYKPPLKDTHAPSVLPTNSYLSPPVPTATHIPPQHPIPITGYNPSYPLQHPTVKNPFTPALFYERNERFKYYDSKPQIQTHQQPRTYKEFREAKERALAQEAALKRAAEVAEAKRITEALKENEKDKLPSRDELNKNINEKKSKAGDINKNDKDNNKEKDKPVTVAVESTLDKMYRTQNFCTQFPKASTSFKIPKKKTEGKPREETKTLEPAKQKATESQSKTSKEDKQPLNKATHAKEIEKPADENQEKSDIVDNTRDILNSRDPRCRAKTGQKSLQDKKENKKHEDQDKNKGKCNVEEDLVKETQKKKVDEQANENDSNKSSTNLDFSKTTTHILGDIVITSSDNQVTPKPQQNLDKFNKLAQELSPKPQRILRRRNTMVVFDSAPLVDKEKLKKANAKLFEDVQDEERKRRQDEVNRIARRNKHLEEMFKKTDDNCTVSTQNIIEGKRRTRPTMNFNETANVLKVFKPITVSKDANATNSSATQSLPATATAPVAVPAAARRSNFKIKLAKLDIKSKVAKDGDKQNKNEEDENEAKEKTKATTAKQKQVETEEEAEEEEDTSEEETNTKTKKIGPKSKTRKVNKKVQAKEDETNFEKEQEEAEEQSKGTQALQADKKSENNKEQLIENEQDDKNDNKTKKSVKAKVTKAKKLVESEDESTENEQEDKKENKIKKSVKAKVSKFNKKLENTEESEESEEESISKESKQTKGKSKKVRSTKGSKKLHDTDEETEKDSEEDEEVEEEKTFKENKTRKVKARAKKIRKKLEVTEEEETEEESETNQQNKTKRTVKTKLNKTQNKAQLESTEEREKETPLNSTKKLETNTENANNNNSKLPASSTNNNETEFKPNPPEDEHQNCAVSSTSADNTPEELQNEAAKSSFTVNSSAMKKELDDNEPSSTASKSQNATPTPEANVEVLNEIVEKIVNNSDREHVLGLLGEILSEEKLKLIKSIIDTSLKQNEELNKQQKETTEESAPVKQEKEIVTTKPKAAERNKVAKQKALNKEEHEEDEEKIDEDDTPLKSLKALAQTGAKKQSLNKKKRSELDRLNEDIREMFICEGVLTATGRRMCTIMGEKAETEKKYSEQTEKSNKRKSTNTRNLRRSLRSLKVQDETEEDDNISLSTRNSELSLEDAERSNSAESTPQRKMPVLKPHTPIKIPEEVTTKAVKTKEANKRKTDNKLASKNKKAKLTKDETESEDKDSETEADEEEDHKEQEVTKANNALEPIKNTNVHWHYQSKYVTWCMICDKRLSAKVSGVHFKAHHGENYISRLAPVLLQKFKQDKSNRPLFGVDRGQRQNSWFFRCPFCLQYFNTTLNLWLEHFLNHTVEFRYECSKCHHGNNNRSTVKRHLKFCAGATIITSAVKLIVPTEIKAHVCHLCNFLQLKRPNLERHYMEQHQIDKKTVELSGYTITLFNVDNVECVPEDKAAEREKQAWKSIEKNEQAIDIEDEDEDQNKSKDKEFTTDEDISTANISKDKKSIALSNELEMKQTSAKESSKQQNTMAEKSSSALEPSLQTKEFLVCSFVLQNKTSAASGVEELDKVEKQKGDVTPNTENVDLEQAREAVEDKQNHEVSPKSKVIATMSVVQSKDSDQETSVEPAKDLEKSKEKDTQTSKTSDASKNFIESKELQTKEVINNEIVSDEESTQKPLSDEKQLQSTLDDSSEETLTLVYVSETEEPAEVISDFEVIYETDTQQHIQDELLTLAAQAADNEQEKPNEQNIQDELLPLTTETAGNKKEKVVEQKTPATEEIEAQASISDIISSSIDLIYKRGTSSKRKSLVKDSSEAKKLCNTQSNVFITTHEENSRSPTPEFLVQSIINIEQSNMDVGANKNKPITMAERLSQRFRDINSANPGSKTPTLTEATPKENKFEKLINDTLKELEMEKDSVSKHSANETTPCVSPVPSCSSFSSAFSQAKANVFGKHNKPVKDLEMEPEKPQEAEIKETKLLKKVLTMLNVTDKSKEATKEADEELPKKSSEDITEKNKNSPTPTSEIITVISDDEEWEDIEITETAPAVPSTSTGNLVKSKNKGLLQKFGLFKGNKNKKHLTPLAFMPKKKNKDKSPLTNNNITSNTTTTTPVGSPSTSKPNNTSSATNNINNSINTPSSLSTPSCTANVTSSRSATNSPFAHLRHNLGFKPVINIMDDLLPESPCNDPIDLVPELAPLEPLQDLNDISSILDSNLSAVNINVNNNQTSIEEALDFVNEQQEQQQQIVKVIPDSQNSNSNCSGSNTSTLTSIKSPINSIYHVGFSKQSSGENPFKFYCLLENCSFLFSSDAVGLETHFMMEHAQIKWNGYCYCCQTQCQTECHDGLSITKEIKHMMDKHANTVAVELTNTDSNSCSPVVQEERPKIKLRRLTGDCLSRSTPEITETDVGLVTNATETKTKASAGNCMLGALLEAKPKPPTIDMPPQPEMPLTEPLLLDNNKKPLTPVSKNAESRSKVSWIRVGDVTVILDHSPPLNVQLDENPTPSLQISSVVSLNPDSNTSSPKTDSLQMPKISNVRTLAAKAGNLRSQQFEKERQDIEKGAENGAEVFAHNSNPSTTAATNASNITTDMAAESLEVSQILANANKPSSTVTTDTARRMNEDDSPVIVAETVPIAQNKTGDFVITQTLSAQYDESSSTHLGFNINIAATGLGQDNTNKDPSTNSAMNTSSSTSSASNTPSSSCSLTSRQYKCMAANCKFVSRVPVAMSDHLRFHERRNFSNKRDYLSCGFCFYTASDVEDYMKHADEYHIISKTGAPPPKLSNNSETAKANSMTKKLLNILNSSGSGSCSSSNTTPTNVNSATYIDKRTTQTTTPQVQDTEEVYLKKLRDTIDEIVGPTGLADDKLYRCVIKNCQTQLTESTFLTHIMYHINTTGLNPQHYTYKCPHCSARYNRASGIKVHIKNHARNRYFCYLCEQTTANPGQLQKHFSEKHWHTLQMYTKELLKPKLATDGSKQVLDSGYFVAYTQDLSEEEIRKFGEKLILDWQRKKAGSKTHFKSSEIDLLPMTAIFTRDINCGECEYKTKVRTNMYRHLQMHKQNPGLANKTGVAKVYSVDPVNPVPCLNSSERFFDKMTNLASSSLIPNSSSSSFATTNAKSNYKIPYVYIESTKRLTCHLKDCNYHTITEELFRTHMTTLHSNTLTYRCGFCQEEICKRGVTTDRIINHLRFHGECIYRCEECNYLHHMRYVVERHINEKHSSMKVNIVKHERTIEDNMEGVTTVSPFAGKKYKESAEPIQTSTTTTRSSNSENPTVISTTSSTKGKGKWICDACGQKAASVAQIQTHCQQQHGVKNQYKCVHCIFGSQQLSQILTHIDDKHSGMVREARTMYHREHNAKEQLADTRPLWQRNDPTRVRHIRGILMEDEEESLTINEEDIADDNDEDDNEEIEIEIEVEEGDEDLNGANYLVGYEFGCFHCDYKGQTFEELKEQHYKTQHNYLEDKAKPFWYRLLRKFCCPECRAYVGTYKELEQHLKLQHSKLRFYGADVTTLENADNTLRLLCGFCPVHCANAEELLKHQLRVQHTPQDVRIENNQQIMDILNLGQAEIAYQCTLCTDIFPNRVAIVEHACNAHAGEESFSFRELSNSLIYRCHICCFTSTKELDLMRHMLDHYQRFKTCQFCAATQSSFTVYMQHCYAQHKNAIHKFKTLYPLMDIRKFLLQMLIIFPSGLVLNKRNLINTKYGKTDVIDELYEEMYKISQEPPIPRLSIARLVARKSIEAQHKHLDATNKQDDILQAMQSKPKPIFKRRRTLVLTLEENKAATASNNAATVKPKINFIENKPAAAISRRRTTVDQREQQQQQDEFSAPLQMAKISKRRRTVAVDRDTLFSSNLSSNFYTNLLMDKQNKKRKYSSDCEITYPLNLDMEPYSYYGQKPEQLDLSKIYTKVAIGGIKTPLTIDKFKLLFNTECQLKLQKCDEESPNELRNYNQYKHIKKACPASHKIKYK